MASSILFAGYSSLPRSAMSEPMGNCHIPGSNGLSYFGNYHLHELNSGCGIQMGCLEPVSEEARFRASSNMDNLNMVVGVNGEEENEYYLKTDPPVQYTGSFKSGGTSGRSPPQSNEMGGLYQSTDGSGLVYHAYTQPHDHVLTTTSIVNNSSASSNNPITSKSGDVRLKETDGNNQFIQKKNTASRQTCAKDSRRFHFFGAFIPSFLFVVIAMTIATIIILESDSELLGRIRNMPEMINLRYQYYEPLKDYLLQKFTRNFLNNHHNHNH